MPRTGKLLDAVNPGLRSSGSAGSKGNGNTGEGVTEHNELKGIITSADSYISTERVIHLTAAKLKEINDSIKNSSRITYKDGYLLYDNTKIKAGFADDFPDTVTKKKTFSAGIEASTLKVSEIAKLLKETEFGEFIKSMTAGKGAGIDEHGNMQVESMEVRSYLKVMELIYNRLNALEGDYSFTDFGTIDFVEKIDEITYILTLRKRWENDFTALQINDILYSIFNGGIAFFTSWMRIIHKDTAANTITIVLFPDNEVPAQKNFAPVKSMNITRRGNSLTKAGHNERQDSWHISSTEGAITFLQNVAKPILEQFNYALSIGKLPKLDIFDNLPINYDQPYLFARGAVIQDLLRIDYNGQIRKDIVDRGLWNLVTVTTDPYRTTTTEVHEVWHLSCKYQCLVDKTIQEPRWNATDWLQVAGDPTLKLELDSSEGLNFVANQVDTTITASVYKGANDITSDIQNSDWEWTRETNDPVSDTLWNSEHANTAGSVHITDSDLGLNILVTRHCKFTCAAYVRNNANNRVETISKSFFV